MKGSRFALFAVLCGFAIAVGAARSYGVLPSHADEKKIYVCTPCHDDHDKTEYEKPGPCPVCGMPLIEKSEVAKAEARMAKEMAAAEHTRRRVAILVFPGVEIIDFTGPYEVFGQAGFEVVTVAERPETITTAMGMKVTPDFTLDKAPPSTVVVVPGGDVRQAQESPAVKAWLNARAEKTEVVLSVCNGAYILARSGLLDGLSATTFASLIDGLKVVAPKTNVVSDKRFVDNGKIVTAAGLSSGIDASLHVVEKLDGRGAAQKVAVNLEYNWDPEGRWVRAQLADRFLRKLYAAAADWDRDILSHEGTPEKWENRWRVRTKETPDQVVGTVASALDVQPVAATGADAKSAASKWTFSDEKGGRWTGSATAAPDAQKAGTLLLTVRIEKARGA